MKLNSLDPGCVKLKQELLLGLTLAIEAILLAVSIAGFYGFLPLGTAYNTGSKAVNNSCVQSSIVGICKILIATNMPLLVLFWVVIAAGLFILIGGAGILIGRKVFKSSSV